MIDWFRWRYPSYECVTLGLFVLGNGRRLGIIRCSIGQLFFEAAIRRCPIWTFDRSIIEISTFGGIHGPCMSVRLVLDMVQTRKRRPDDTPIVALGSNLDAASTPVKGHRMSLAPQQSKSLDHQ